MNQSINFVGGAPKSGTSSLFYWLNNHPDVSGTEPKETFFLIDENNPLRNAESNWIDSETSHFLGLFDDTKKVKLEATTHLLYQGEDVLNYIKNHFPNSKFVFVVRDPVSRIQSSFNYTKNNLLRVKEGFGLNDYLNILRSDNTVSLSDHVTNVNSLYVLSRDLEYGAYSNYLKKWLSFFDSSQIKLVLFEDLKVNPNGIVNDICDFFSLSKEFYQGYGFEKENESITVKHKELYKVGKIFSGFFGKQSSLKKKLKRLISHSPKKQGELISDENKRFLMNYYREEGAQLKKLGFDLDYQKWNKNG